MEKLLCNCVIFVSSKSSRNRVKMMTIWGGVLTLIFNSNFSAVIIIDLLAQLS